MGGLSTYPGRRVAAAALTISPKRDIGPCPSSRADRVRPRDLAAARGVTLSSRAINPVDRIGRAMTGLHQCGQARVRTPTNQSAIEPAAGEQPSVMFFHPPPRRLRKAVKNGHELVVESGARRRSHGIRRRPVFRQRRCDRVRERALSIAPTRSLPSQALC